MTLDTLRNNKYVIIKMGQVRCCGCTITWKNVDIKYGSPVGLYPMHSTVYLILI